MAEALTGELYCCSGCEVAHAWIAQAGLEDFYKLRQHEVSSEISAQGVDKSSNFAHFDDPEYLRSLGHRPGNCELSIVGLRCAACVWLLEQLPSRFAGLNALRVNWQAQRVSIQWDPTQLKLSEIAGVVEQLGYEMLADDQHAHQRAQAIRRQELLRLAITGAAAGNVMLITLALYSGELSDMGPTFRSLFEIFAAVFALPAVLYGAAPFYRAAYASLRLGRLHLDVPIACGVLVGYLSGLHSLWSGQGELYFDTISLLVFLLLIGRRLQDESRRWAYSQAGALNLLLPASAVVWREESWQQVSRMSLQDQDRVRIEPGEAIPADGCLLCGESQIDARSLTGESRPQPIFPGSTLLAGTINLEAAVTMRVEKREEQTRLGRVASSLSSATSKRSSVEQGIDKVSAYFSWVVLLLSLGAGAYWGNLVGLQEGLDVALSTLIISCPCALGLATPLALALARAKGARMGVVIAQDRALEDLARLRNIAFDKTGTLTTGELEVSELQSERSTDTLKSMISALEARCRHPIARSLLKWSQGSPADPLVSEVQERPGQGIEAMRAGETLRLGRFRDSAFQEAVQRWLRAHPRSEQEAQSTIYLLQGSQVIASFGLEDTLHQGAAEWIQELRQQGRRLVILSGDEPSTVAHIAAAANIADARGGLLPEDKLAALQEQPWVMIGDGINDAPALRCASVGVAVGQHAEIAARVADIYVIRSGIAPLRSLFALADQSRRVVRANLCFALVYNTIFALAAITGHIRPLVAAVIMPLSSLTVLGNSWWSLRQRSDEEREP